MFKSKLKIMVLALSICGVLTLGASAGFGAGSDGNRYWKAAPEYPSAWKAKMHLMGYLGRSGIAR